MSHVARAPQLNARAGWLDGLRAVAALMVFGHHASMSYVGGWDAGVMVFFSLSGYLLYRPFLERRVDLRTYTIRRAFRILPAYLIASIGIAALISSPLDPVDTLLMSRPVIAVAWTLRIEVLFYVALPVVAWVTRGRREPLLLLAVASLVWAGIEMLGRAVIPIDLAAWLWAFVPGMLVAHLAVRRPAVLARADRPLVPAIGIALVASSIVPDIRFPDVPAAVGSAVVLAWLLHRPAPRPALARAMAVGAALSYSFYLWHEPVLDAVGRSHGIVGVIEGLIVTAAIAGAVYVAVEWPSIVTGRRLARRIERQPAMGATAPSGRVAQN